MTTSPAVATAPTRLPTYVIAQLRSSERAEMRRGPRHDDEAIPSKELGTAHDDEHQAEERPGQDAQD